MDDIGAIDSFLIILPRSQTETLFILVELEKLLQVPTEVALWNTFRYKHFRVKNEILLLICFSEVSFVLGCRVLKISKKLRLGKIKG